LLEKPGAAYAAAQSTTPSANPPQGIKMKEEVQVLEIWTRRSGPGRSTLLSGRSTLLSKDGGSQSTEA
jgi:hypothetical protein